MPFDEAVARRLLAEIHPDEVAQLACDLVNLVYGSISSRQRAPVRSSQ
jgi:hypothetical protein